MSVNECEVTRSDQTLINRFARLNAKCEELESDLNSKRGKLENTRQAVDELFLQDEHVLIHTGEVFATMSVAMANDWCETSADQLDTQVKAIESEIRRMKEEMNCIKAKLYSKFGQNINLENE